MIINSGYCDIEIDDPNAVEFESPYFEKIYRELYDRIDPDNPYPHIDFDDFRDNSIGFDILALAAADNHTIPAREKDKIQKAMFPFIERYPVFFNVIQNLSIRGISTIQSAEVAYGAPTDSNNFIDIKKVIDQWNQRRWTRTKGTSEAQSGVSVLGTVSETLLETALGSFIDGTNFFKNNRTEVQSYGDFVLMCLPNNLWLSVKSNFARERLLASGFTTDIIGVGFFTDDREFTSGAKLRNFQKVGFLAMYVPDIPITDEQVQNGTSTFEAIESYYTGANKPLPLNLNGKLFIRRLSALHSDIEGLLDTENIQHRTTIGF